RAERAQLVVHAARGAADGRRDLEHRLHQLGVDARLELAVVGDAGEHGVDVLDEVPRLGVEEHVLLLDAERVLVALAEAVVVDAAHGDSVAAMEALRQVEAWPSEHAAVAVVGRVEAVHGDLEREFAWASVTKLATAVAVLVAAEEGIVDLDEPAGPPGS